MATRDGDTSPEELAKGTNLDPAMADALAAREAARRRELAGASDADAGATAEGGESTTDRSAMRVDENSVMPSLPDTADEDSPAGTDAARGGGGLLAGAVLPETGDEGPTFPPPADLGIDPGATFLDRDLDVRLPELDSADAEQGVNTEGATGDIGPAPEIGLGPDAPTVGMDLDVRLPGGAGDGEAAPGAADETDEDAIDVGVDVPEGDPGPGAGGAPGEAVNETDEDAIDVGVDAPEEAAGAEAGGEPAETGSDPITPDDADGTGTNGTMPEDDGPGQGHAYGRDRDDDHGRGQGRGRGHDDEDDPSAD